MFSTKNKQLIKSDDFFVDLNYDISSLNVKIVIESVLVATSLINSDSSRYVHLKEKLIFRVSANKGRYFEKYVDVLVPVKVMCPPSIHMRREKFDGTAP